MIEQAIRATNDFSLPDPNGAIFADWCKKYDREKAAFVLRLTEKTDPKRFILLPLCAISMRYSIATPGDQIASVARECNCDPEVVAYGLSCDEAMEFLKTYTV